MRRMLPVGRSRSTIGFATRGLGGFSTGFERGRAAFRLRRAERRDIRRWRRSGRGRQRHHDPQAAPRSRTRDRAEAVRQSFAQAWPNYAEWSVVVNDVRVRVSQGQAVVLATTPVHVKMRNSDTASDFIALATIVYERRDGRWLIIHQHVSQLPR